MPRGEREGCKGRDESFVSECQRREGNSRRAIQVQEAHKQREKRRGRRYHVLCNVAVFIHHFCYLLHLQWSPRLGKIVIGDIAFIFFSVCTGWRDHITSTESCSRSRKKKKKRKYISAGRSNPVDDRYQPNRVHVPKPPHSTFIPHSKTVVKL
jgi:hypothetical protein